MAFTGARRIVLALLVIAVVGAPVLGSVPTCCAKDAAKSQACCCRNKRVASSEGCCAKGHKACCAKHQAVAAIAVKPPVSSCDCQAGRPPAAVAEEQAQVELRFKQLSIVSAVTHPAASSPEMAAVGPSSGAGELAPGPARRILFCRWLV
jgi:hypothetical protein